MTCDDRQSGVQDGRLYRVGTIGRLHAITSEHRHLKNTGPCDKRMILSSTGRAICVSGKAQNQNAWRLPEGVYRSLGMPLMDEELGSQPVPRRQVHGDGLFACVLFQCNNTPVFLGPACHPIPIKHLRAEARGHKRQKFGAIMLCVGPDPTPEKHAPQEHTWQEMRARRKAAEKAVGL